MSLKDAREVIKRAKLSGELYLSLEELTDPDLQKLMPEIKELKNLTSLYLSGNQLTNADFLKELKNLTTLDLSGNKITNADFLKELKNLTSLDLRSNQLTNADFLKELKNLTSLDLGFNQLTNYDFLKELKNLTSLDLSGNQLTNADFLKELKNLTTLDLRGNQITNVDFLKELKNLTSLDLRGNQLTNADFLKELKNLTSLDLGFNQLTNVDFLKELKNLTSLDLRGNQLTNADFLKELKNLTSLDLRSNQLTNADFLKELKNLTSLDLGFNQLTNVDFLKELKNLTTLDLRSNQLTNADFLKELKNLTSLDLRGNQLTNYDFLKELKNLTKLYLGFNQITNYDFLKELKNLTSLDLSGNNLTNADFLKELKNLTSLDLRGNPNLELPENLKKLIEEKRYIGFNKSEIEQIRNYYEQLEEQGKDYIYEARVLIVGEPGAGKTTLFKKLENNKYNPENAAKKDKLSTVGIGINKNWSFPFVKDKTKNFTAHLWDFGGQEIQYKLHQYFLTQKSLYILVIDDRSEHGNLNYWFDVIATLGEDCPVLIVLNEKNHQGITNFNLKKYRQQFADKIKDIESISVDFSNDSDKRFAQLQDKIQQKLSNLHHIGQALPAKWKIIREQLEKRSQTDAHISLADYYDICQKNGLAGKNDCDYLLDYLHDLGIALNYQKDEKLKEIVILNANWVIDALYAVLKEAKIQKSEGIFSQDYIYRIWERDGYKKDDWQILLNLMLKGKFEIAYKLKGVQEYIVPILLPRDEPDYKFEKDNLLEIYLKYVFMPPGIISRLIVRENESIAEQNKKQIVWQQGALLNNKTSTAEIIEDIFNNEIRIKVSGKNVFENKDFITILRNKIYEIHRDWFDNNLEVDEFVPCNCEICSKAEVKEFFKLKKLQKRLLDNELNIQCDKSYKYMNVRGLLEGIYVEEKGKTIKESSGQEFGERNLEKLFLILNDSQKIQLELLKNKNEKTEEEKYQIVNLASEKEELVSNAALEERRRICEVDAQKWARTVSRAVTIISFLIHPIAFVILVYLIFENGIQTDNWNSIEKWTFIVVGFLGIMNLFFEAMYFIATLKDYSRSELLNTLTTYKTHKNYKLRNFQENFDRQKHAR